jgi:8-oxo-dGTP diphosphatase
VIAGPAGFAHCPACGQALKPRMRGDRLRPHCPACGRVVFHNPAVGVAIVLVDEDDRLLLARRSRSYAGQWCIPCGYVEWDEDVRVAAAREVTEETGLDVNVGDVFAVHSNFHDVNQHTVGIWFRGTVLGGRLQPADDVDQVGFYPLDDLPGPLAFPTDQLVVDQLRHELTQRAAPTSG